MSRRSLLGGSRRKGQAEERQVAESSWLKQTLEAQPIEVETTDDEATEEAVDQQSQDTPDTDEDASGAETENASTPELNWNPDGAVSAEPASAGKLRENGSTHSEIPWKFDEAGLEPTSPKPTPEDSSAKSIDMSANNDESGLEQDTELRDHELYGITIRDVRNRRMTRWGWIILLTVLVLTFLFSLP